MSLKKKKGGMKKSSRVGHSRSRGRAEDALLQLVAKVGVAYK